MPRLHQAVSDIVEATRGVFVAQGRVAGGDGRNIDLREARWGMSSQHTPGPWKSLPEEADKPYIRIRGTALGRRYKIANVMDPGYSGVTDQDFDETRANARLIANAPDMYAALLEITQISEYNTSSMGWVVKRAKDAIAKTMGPA